MYERASFMFNVLAQMRMCSYASDMKRKPHTIVIFTIITIKINLNLMKTRREKKNDVRN